MGNLSRGIIFKDFKFIRFPYLLPVRIFIYYYF
ncbi:hypothetical protein SAMN06265375_101449 [Muriicola jejuensis]|nr:hypothetical protein SAMN06265375_101449 [Muriicola jejuensis]